MSMFDSATKWLRDIVGPRTPWWDWGHSLMALTGRDDYGSWGPPRVRDLYYRQVWEYPADGDHLTKPTGRRLETTRHAMTAWDGVMGRDGRSREDWKVFDSQDDGHTIRIGYLGDDGRLHDAGIEGHEVQALFRRWLLWDGWVRAEWFGLRRWLYYKGLRAAIEQRVPFTCQRVPDAGSGGYSHWHCDVAIGLVGALRRLCGNPARHTGPHRFGNYSWDDSTPGARVQYDPAVRA